LQHKAELAGQRKAQEALASEQTKQEAEMNARMIETLKAYERRGDAEKKEAVEKAEKARSAHALPCAPSLSRFYFRFCLAHLATPLASLPSMQLHAATHTVCAPAVSSAPSLQ
jgi:hypothetical protein